MVSLKKEIDKKIFSQIDHFKNKTSTVQQETVQKKENVEMLHHCLSYFHTKRERESDMRRRKKTSLFFPSSHVVHAVLDAADAAAKNQLVFRLSFPKGTSREKRENFSIMRNFLT